MRQSSLLFARVWLVIPLLALGFTVWVNARRIQRIEHIAALCRGESIPSATSPSGYAGGIRERVLPDQANRSFEWIGQTQHMLAHGEWRVRQIKDENAPFGRATHTASLYKWWLGLVAWSDHHLTGRPLGLSVERGALHADPLLHLLMLGGLTLFAARYFGAWAASLVALSGTFLFPFAARFLPGVPDDFSLVALCALGGLLPLLAGFRALDRASDGARASAQSGVARPSASFWFSLAGIFGGFGIWTNPASQVPLILGLILGALLAAWVGRSALNDNERSLPAPPWRVWSLSGAITVLAASLIEFYPAHLGAWEIRAVHPLYGLGWIGGGELLARTVDWMQRGRSSWQASDVAIKLLALAAFLAVPFVMFKTGNPGFTAMDAFYYRLTNRPDGIMAPNLAGWIHADGITPVLWTTLLPLLLLAPALWFAVDRRTAAPSRRMLTVMLGPVVAAIVLASFQIKWWGLLDAALVPLLILVTGAIGREGTLPWRRWIWAASVVLVLLPGIFQLVPSRRSVTDNSLTVTEAEGLLERDLAHWLAKRSGGGTEPLILAPPSLTSALSYYGALRGVGTLSWENQEGLSFAIRLAISTSRDEAAVLLRRRGVTHLVIPSWDAFFDSYLQSASVQVGEQFYESLKSWKLPLWLRPVPYQLPSIPGFKNHSVMIFEVVDDQAEPAAASRLTEYFVELGLFDLAKASHQTLLKYPADFGVLVARAQLWAALRDADNFTGVFEPLLGRLAGGADRAMAWDRRVSLAIVLGRGNRMDLARSQVQRCLDELNEARLRSLTTHALYHLLVLKRTLGLEIVDPKLRSLALDLLSAELRQQL